MRQSGPCVGRQPCRSLWTSCFPDIAEATPRLPVGPGQSGDLRPGVADWSGEGGDSRAAP